MWIHEYILSLSSWQLGSTSGSKAPPFHSQPRLRFNRAEHAVPVPLTPYWFI